MNLGAASRTMRGHFGPWVMDPIVTLPLVLALGAVAGGAIQRKRSQKKRAREAMRSVDVPGTRKDAALLIALGHDPDKHRIRPIQRGSMRGLQIVDFLNRPVRFYTERQLKKPAVRKAWREALRTVSVTA